MSKRNIPPLPPIARILRVASPLRVVGTPRTVSVAPIHAAAPLFNIDGAVVLRDAVGNGLGTTAVLSIAAPRVVDDGVRVRGGDEHVAVGLDAETVLGVTAPMVINGGVRARSGVPPPNPPSGLVDGPFPSLPDISSNATVVGTVVEWDGGVGRIVSSHTLGESKCSVLGGGGRPAEDVASKSATYQRSDDQRAPFPAPPYYAPRPTARGGTCPPLSGLTARQFQVYSPQNVPLLLRGDGRVFIDRS